MLSAASAASPGTAIAVPAVRHYENFPVASWLCPAHLRPAVSAIYHFARTADDLADEGDLPFAQRLNVLRQYRQALDTACLEQPYATDAPWSTIMQPLQTVVMRHNLPPALLADLLTAFERDVTHTQNGYVYPDHAALLDYARCSANPVGRLMLHLYGVHDADSLRCSDAICSALQLFNFWQDVSVDVPRQRFYLPQDACALHGVDPRAPRNAAPQAIQALMQQLLELARRLMLQGAPLPAQVRRCAGWLAGQELQLVMLGGLRIGAKTGALGAAVVRQRPRIRAWDMPGLLWRSVI